MKITLNLAQQAIVIQAVNRLWQYYYNDECPRPVRDIESALGRLLIDYPSTFLDLLAGQSDIETAAFLCSYLHPKPSVWLVNSGLVPRQKVKHV